MCESGLGTVACRREFMLMSSAGGWKVYISMSVSFQPPALGVTR